jgi:hypothetical protein
MGDLIDVAEPVADDRPPVAVRGVERLLEKRRTGTDRPLERFVGVVYVDIEEGRKPLASAIDEIMTSESPIRSSVGRSGSTSPAASNSVLRKLASAATSSTKRRGVIERYPGRGGRTGTGSSLARCSPRGRATRALNVGRGSSTRWGRTTEHRGRRRADMVREGAAAVEGDEKQHLREAPGTLASQDALAGAGPQENHAEVVFGVCVSRRTERRRLVRTFCIRRRAVRH